MTAQLEQTLVIKEGVRHHESQSLSQSSCRSLLHLQTPEAIEDFQDDPDWPNEAGQGADGGSDEPGRIAIGDKGKARGSPLSTPISAAVHQVIKKDGDLEPFVQALTPVSSFHSQRTSPSFKSSRGRIPSGRR